MTTRLYWFRTDLRLHDQPGLRRALAGASHLLPVYCHDPRERAPTPWGFARTGPHRHRFLAATLEDLRLQLQRLGSGLIELHGEPGAVLPQLVRLTGAQDLHCERIEQPDAVADVQALRDAGLAVETYWFSTLLDPNRLPYLPVDMPRHFTPFRQSIEKTGVQPRPPLAAPEHLPPLPELPAELPGQMTPGTAVQASAWQGDPRSSFPYDRPDFRGGETAALAHLQRYFASNLPLAYKSTRNQLSGTATSTKFSPWLALGALSPRAAVQALRGFEDRHGQGEGSYAIWFELLWRDFFRLLALRARAQSAGIADPAPPALTPVQTAVFAQWRSGATGVSLVDAAMRELAATGFLSNRMRQVVASFLVNELAVPQQAGAAWFASQLLDFDPYSNDGNWRYIAGTGADPRGGRHFNIEKQARDHDPDEQYRVLWSTA
jgi:deoxyribodipyrimidine photo-lyase